MATDQVSICNAAIIAVGGDPIQSIDQSTRSANLLKAIYSQSRDQVLRDHPWKFARKRAVLAPVATAPSFGYDYAYDIPSDCVRVLDTDPDDFDWTVENGQILTDEEVLDIVYTYRHEDESAWPSDFCESFSLKLALQIAYALTQSVSLAESLEKKYKASLAESRAISGMEGILKGLEADDWTDVRR